MKIFIGCVLALSISAAASAQTTVSYGVLAGISAPVGALGASDAGGFGAGSGWHAGGAVSFDREKSPLTIRVEGVYDRFGEATPSCAPLGVNTNQCFGNRPSVWSSMANVLWHLHADSKSKARPYLIAGAGLDHVTLTTTSRIYNSSDTHYTSPVSTGIFSSDSYTKLGINVGAGAQIPGAGKNLSIEARWHMIFDSGQLGDAASKFFLVSAVLRLR